MQTSSDDGEGEIVLHHQPGSLCNRTEYQPLETVLKAGAPLQIATSGGRPTNSNLPYFNLAKAGRASSSSWVGRDSGPPRLPETAEACGYKPDRS